MKTLVPIHTAAVPMSIADACLVRLTEILPDPLLLTTDSAFKMDRRLGRRRSPYECPGISGLAPPALRRIYPP